MKAVTVEPHSGPLIYKKIPEVMRSIGSIGKNQRNAHQNYQFRSIDDVYNALHRPLSEAGVFYVPEVLTFEDQVITSRDGDRERRSIRVRMTVKYTLFAEDGSSISTVVASEAIDTSDKASNKALSAALKYALIQIFCIPTKDIDDSDRETPSIDDKPALVNLKTGEIVAPPKSDPQGDTPVHCGKRMIRSRYKPEFVCMQCKHKIPFTEVGG